MPDVDQQGILHAELDRVRIGYARIAPVPRDVSPILAVRILILHSPRQREEAFKPFRMDAGLAQRQGIAEQLAAAGQGPRIGRGDLSPEGIIAFGCIFDSRLAQQCVERRLPLR